MASLSQFLTTGDLGPIRHGMSRAEVVDALGEPVDESVSAHPQILKYGGLQLTLLKPKDGEGRQVSHIGLYYSPFWEPIPEAVRPVDFAVTSETTMDEVRAFLTASSVRVHSSANGDNGAQLILADGARITFDEGKLHSIAFPKRSTSARKQVSVSLPLELWEEVKALAAREGRSVADLCADWIEDRASQH